MLGDQSIYFTQNNHNKLNFFRNVSLSHLFFGGILRLKPNLMKNKICWDTLNTNLYDPRAEITNMESWETSFRNPCRFLRPNKSDNVISFRNQLDFYVITPTKMTFEVNYEGIPCMYTDLMFIQ